MRMRQENSRRNRLSSFSQGFSRRGGRGIRVVREPGQLAGALESAKGREN